MSCEKQRIFHDFKSIQQSRTLQNCKHHPNEYIELDDEIISICPEQTFEFYFDILDENNSLIFSIDKFDTIGDISFSDKIVYFESKANSERQILFDFNRKIGAEYKVENCGLLINDLLKITDIDNKNDEIIQTLAVRKSELSKPVPPSINNDLTRITDLIVSSKYGILEIKIFIDWAGKSVEIKNTP